MLSIYYGDMPQAIYNPIIYFKNSYTDEWIMDDLSKEMIQDVDKSTVLGARIIDSPVLGAISPRELSGGVKTLISIYKTPDRIFNTGKTTLVEMIGEFYESGTGSGIELRCDCLCRTLGCKDWKTILTTIHEAIVFIDEDNAFLPTNEFAEAVRDSDNYYVLVTREGLPNLPYSIEEIYGIRLSGKYAGLKQIYHEFYHIYGQAVPSEAIQPELVIVEDSNAGFEFYKGFSKGKNYTVISAGGKSNIFNTIQKCRSKNILVIADGAAFGSEMDRVIKLSGKLSHISLYLPEYSKYSPGYIAYAFLN